MTNTKNLTLPGSMVSPNVEESNDSPEVNEDSIIAWMKKTNDGMAIIQRSVVASNEALEKVLKELINLRNDVDDILRKQ